MRGLSDIFAPDNFYAYTFEDAKPHLERFMFKYLGIFPLVAGERPQTDGKRIILSSDKKDFQDDKKEPFDNRNLSLYVSDLLHEILHIREGSFLVDARPYLEGFKNPSLAHMIMNVEDDGRIEFNGAFHPSTGDDPYIRREDVDLLKKSNAYYSAKREFPKTLMEQVMEFYSCKKIVKGLPSEFQFDGAGKSALQQLEGQILAQQIDDADLRADGMETMGDMLNRMDQIGQVVYGEPVEAVFKIVPELYEILTKAIPNIEEEFPTDGSRFSPVLINPEEGVGSTPGEGEEEGGGSGDGEGQGEGEGSGDGKGQEGGSGEGKGNSQGHMVHLGYRGDVHDFSQGEDKGSNLEDITKDYTPQPQEVSLPGVGPSQEKGEIEKSVLMIRTYDDKHNRYNEAVELRVERYNGNNPGFEVSLDKYASQRDEIIEHFSLLQPNKLKRKRFTQEPDEMNNEALLEVLADSNLRVDAGIYDSYSINRRDVLWSILIDISGSTGGTLASGTQVIEVEKEAAGLLYSALTAIEDQVELYAFSTDAITHLYHLHDLANLGSLRPEGANADGVAIRGVIHEMKQFDVKKRNMIVITDGKPVGSGGEGDPVVDTAMAFQEAEAEGIRTVYFNVDNQPADYFSTLTRNCTFAKSIPITEDLPAAVGQYVTEYC